jgi:hypothetical protein
MRWYPGVSFPELVGCRFSIPLLPYGVNGSKFSKVSKCSNLANGKSTIVQLSSKGRIFDRVRSLTPTPEHSPENPQDHSESASHGHRK